MAASFELQQVLDLEKWAQLQEKIALATNLAIILVDYRGKPVTRHSQVKPFCRLARAHPTLAVYCEKCDARGALEAVRTGEPFIYRCHFDILDMAIPILVDDRYVGAIMAGEILATEEQSTFEQVLKLEDHPEVAAFKAQHQELIDAYPRLPATAMHHAAAMLEQLCEYIVSEAIKKEYLVQAYKQSLRIQAQPPTSESWSAPKDSTNLAYLQEELRQSLLIQRLSENSIYQAKNQQLQPAIDAVFANKNAHLDLGQLAALVNLSPTYLSRLLREEFGEPFSQIYAKLKVYWAQELLQNSDLPIAEISDALGFVEPSYFIRSFKKIVGTTPLKWRQAKGR